MARLRLASILLFVSATLSSIAGTIQYSLPPHSMVIDVEFSDDGRLFVASTRELIVIDRSGRARTFAADLSWLSLVVTSDGAVWGQGYGRLLVRIDPATDQIARFHLPDFIESFGAGDDGALWVITNRNVRSLVRLDRDGQVLSSVPLADLGRFGPRLVAAAGAMWGVHGTELVRLGAAGGTATFPLPLPNTYWFLSGGDFLWVANVPWNSGDVSQMLRVGPAGEVLSRYAPPVDYIIGAAADRFGNLWLNDEYSGGIGRMTPSGEFTPITTLNWDGHAYDAQPMAIARDGRIAVAKSDIGFFPAFPARGVVFIADPAQPHEIPALSPTALLLLALSIAVAGAVAARLTH